MPVNYKELLFDEEEDAHRSIRAVVLGPPGAGKRRHAPELAKKYKVCHLTTGGMLHDAESGHSRIDEEVKAVSLDLGGRVADDLFYRMVEEHLDSHACRNGFLIDGFPRSVTQAQRLDKILDKRGTPIDTVVEFGVKEEDWLVRRIVGRLIHLNSGRTYHEKYKPPLRDWTDDKTGEPLVHSSSDDESTVKKRIGDYYARATPVLDYYKKKAVHTRIDAHQPTEYVGLGVAQVFDDHLIF